MSDQDRAAPRTAACRHGAIEVVTHRGARCIVCGAYAFFGEAAAAPAPDVELRHALVGVLHCWDLRVTDPDDVETATLDAARDALRLTPPGDRDRREAAVPDVHVFPDVGRPHVLEGTGCWCHPRVEIVPPPQPAAADRDPLVGVEEDGSHDCSGAGCRTCAVTGQTPAGDRGRREAAAPGAAALDRERLARAVHQTLHRTWFWVSDEAHSRLDDKASADIAAEYQRLGARAAEPKPPESGE